MTLAAVLQRSLRAAITATATMVIAIAVWADPADPSDPRVVALASSLSNSPAAIHQYVRDNIGIEVYSGSMRGARGTLASKAGNPLDRASLTVALLRAAGFVARYAQGTLSTPQAEELFARMFTDPARILGCSNNPPGFSGNARADLVAGLQSHTWVEYRSGSSGPYTTLDTAFASASPGQTFTVVTQNFDAIPVNQRHTVRIRLEVETFTQAAAAFGLALGSQMVLDQSFDSADLVDKPITVSHFVDSYRPPSLTIAATQNKYSPYLTVGDSRTSLSTYEIIRGSDYSEILTSFPIGSILVTGVFVNIDVTDSSGQTTSYRRPMYDRIGYVTRMLGGSVSTSAAALTQPVLSELDLMTISVSPARQALDDFVTRKARLDSIQSQLTALSAQVSALPAPGLRDATQQATVRGAINASRYALIAGNELALASLLGAADKQADDHALRTLVKAYIASPKITLAQSRLLTDSIVTSLDIRKNDLRVIPLPGIAYQNARNFERNRGLGESILEGQILSRMTGDPSQSIASVLTGMPDASGYLPVTSVNLSVIDTLNLSQQAKLRITEAVHAGRAILAPINPVIVSGKPVTAWLETDPNTGYTISTMEDGSHGSIVEYAFTLKEFYTNGPTANLEHLIGRVEAVGLFGIALTAAIIESVAQNRPFDGIVQDLRATVGPILKGIVKDLKTLLKGWKLLPKDLKAQGGAVKELMTGLVDGLDDMAKMFLGEDGDPPLPGTLFSSATPQLPGPQAPSATPGLTLSSAIDTRFTLPFGGSEFPGVYLVRAVNTGPMADTFRFNSTGGGSSLAITDVQYVLPSLKIPAGGTAEFHVCMQPNPNIPTAGTPGSFTINGASVTSPTVTATVSGSFTTPAAPALSIYVQPDPSAALPGTAVPVMLTLNSLGNQAVNVSLALRPLAGLTVTGLPSSVSLAVGEVKSLPLTVTIAADVTPGTDFSELVTAAFGASSPVQTTFNVNVTSAISRCIAPSAVLAVQLGRDNLSGLLGILAADVDTLATHPDSASEKQAVLTEIDALITLLNAPFVASTTSGFAAARATLAAASAGAVGAALSSLDTQFCALRAALQAAYGNGFRVYLSPAVTTNLPNANTHVDINIFNDAANPRAMNLSVTGLPSGVTATFNTARVVVPANNHTNSYQTPETYVTFANGSTALAFDYQIVVTPEDDPASVKSAAGQLTVRPEVIRVVDVTTSPPYGNAGTSFTPTVRLLSAVNDSRAAFIRYQIRDRNNVVMGTSGPLYYTFAIGDNVLTVPLNAFSTTGYADGPYTITGVITDASDNAIPGATGSGSFFVGQPFAATITVAPTSIAPGTSTVNVSLNLDRSLVGQQSIKLRSTLTLPAAPMSFARNGNYLYVCQSSGISIVDVTNPDAPIAVPPSFGTALLTGGYNSVNCSVYSNRLIVNFDRDLGSNTASLKVAVFDIAGTSATSPVLITPTPISTGKQFGFGATFQGTNAYIFTQKYLYNPFSQFIFEQHGNLLKFDFSNPNAPVLSGELYHAFTAPTVPADNQPDSGGSHLIYGVAPHTANQALLATTSSSDGNFAGGLGRLLTIDTAALNANCPGAVNPCIVSTLDVPQTKVLSGVAFQGGGAVVSGDTQGIYDNLSGFTGNVTFSAIDLNNPSAPTVSSTLITGLNYRESEACNPARRNGGSPLRALTNNYYAIGAYNNASCTWVMALVDADNPAQLRVLPYDVPDSIRDFSLNGSLLYVITASSVLVFDYTAITGPSITANVVVPKGTDVALVAGSFNLAPSSIASTATMDTYTWLQPSVAPITWQATVSSMQPGSSRDVATGGSIGFTLPTLGSGTLTLGAAAVTANHIVAISPASHAPPIQIGAPATFTITLSNPGAASVTYSLAVQGVPTSWVKALVPSVVVAANSTATTPLILQTDIAASGGAFPFRVVATSGGASDAAVASLANYYSPDLGGDYSSTVYSSTAVATPNPATGALANTTTVTVRLTNTGTGSETYYLGINSLPINIGNFYWHVSFPQDTVAIAPGEFVDLKAMVEVPNHAVLGMNTITLNVYAGFGGLRSTVTILVNVVDAGVSLSISPNSGPTSAPFVATVTNLASVADTFDLTNTGPLGPTVTAASNAVTLAAGASTTVNLTVGNAASFAAPGTSSFGMLAISRASSAAFARASAAVTIQSAAAVSVIGQPSSTTITSTPLTKSVNVLIQNLGNTEDVFNLAITSSTGPITAQLIDVSGGTTSAVNGIAIPAFSIAVVRLTATVSGAATVTVRATSQSNTSIQSSATITFTTAPTCNLDIDGDGLVRPSTDGLLITRYLLGLSGTALIEGAYNPAFGTLAEITSRLGVLSSNNWLDIDGNGQSLAASDGLLLLRALFGFTETTVTDDALGAPPQARSDWAAIRNYLNTTCQLGLP
ncbi:MAG: transglutaminase domain-containing protein [Casimicrobium sp.]